MTSHPYPNPLWVDVIIPSYNRSHYLERAIQSVLNQTYQDFNLIIVDDGSTDETASMMRKCFCHPKVQFLQKENGGVSSARNVGIKHSKAEWIAFLDSDDEWLPHKLEAQVEFLKNHPQYRFIHSNEIWIRNGIRVNPKNKFDKSSKDLFERSLELCLISPSTVIMQKGLCQELGYFDESFPVCEDYDLWLKVLTGEVVGFISDHLIKKYGGHEDQLSTKFAAMDFWRIKSMVNLLDREDLTEEKIILLLKEIKKKSLILIKGYVKHQNQTQHQELLRILERLPRGKAEAGFP